MPDPLSPISGNRQKIAPAVDGKYAPPPPTEISDGNQSYIVGQKLGRGGFAICYQAQVQQTKQLVALKVVKTQMVKKVEEKFRTELQIHSKMRHRHIAEFYRAFTLDERTFVVLELCGMGSFKEMIGYRKSLTPPEVRRFGVQILGALSYLHSRSIIHRDLKMANIFLDNNMEPKIGDFGLAAVLLTSDQYGVVRRTTLCGTPNYIAPEVLSKKNGHDTKADIWSFGVLIYTLMVGVTPFSRPGDQHNNDVFARVKEADYSWPESCRDRVPDQAKDLVKTCLQDNSLRPDADEVAQHSFFSMSGGIPNSISKDALKALPACVTKRAPFEMRASYARISLEQLREQSGLGTVRPLDHGRSVYHEFIAEENAKRTPVMPLASVYLPNEKALAKPARRVGTVPRSKSRPNLPTVTTKAEKVTEKTTRIATRSASVNTITHDTIRRPPTTETRPSESPIEPYFPYFDGREPLRTVFEQTQEQQSRHLIDLANTLTSFLSADENTPLDWPTEPANLPPRVERWCNYSNKYGIGYTMSNGAIGCLFITESHGNRAVVVPGTVNHYLQRGTSKAAFPTNSQRPCFIERSCNNTLKALLEAPSLYEFTSLGKIDLLSGVSDEVNERRKAIFNWSRFANYMISRLAAENPEDIPPPTSNRNPNPALTEIPASSSVMADFPMAYQRLGTVNVWAHTSGALQFDFSQDHTKVLLSPSGQYIEFWYPEASEGSASGSEDQGSGGEKNRYRGCIRCPTRMVFSGPVEENRAVKQLASAAKLRSKLGFVCDALRMWAREGGLGTLGKERIYWDGKGTAVDKSEVPKRATWLTVKL